MNYFRITFIFIFFTLTFIFPLSADTRKHFAVSANSNFKISYKATLDQLIIQDLKTNRTLKVIQVGDKSNQSSKISGVHDASLRSSFMVALKDSPELWEINYQQPAPAGFGEWVHDYREDSGEADTRLFPIRKLVFKTPLSDFFLDSDNVKLMSIPCKGNIQIIDLDLGRKVAEFELSMMHLGGASIHPSLGLTQDCLIRYQKKSELFRSKNCD